MLNVAVFLWLDPILRWLQVPYDIYSLMRNYLWIIFWGIVFTFLYNFYAALLRAVGDSVTPLWFLAVSVVLNIGLDLFLILVLDQRIEGACSRTVIAQERLHPVSYCIPIKPALSYDYYPGRYVLRTVPAWREITSFSTLTCVQQSVMNFVIDGKGYK
ncbi:MAG: MATE family efflux transporter [Parabacteroides merdae]